jgi:hypothetical protein
VPVVCARCYGHSGISLNRKKYVYKLYDAQDKVENHHIPNEGHSYGINKRLGMYPFMAKHLDLDISKVTGADGKIDESATVIEKTEDLYVFDQDCPIPAHAKKGK